MLRIIAYKDAETFELELGELESIQLRFSSGLFDFDALPGSFSFPASIPITPVNNRAFDFAYKRNKADSNIRDLSCDLKVSDTLIASGTIILEKIDSEYSFNIVLSTSQFAYKGEDRDLQSFDYGGEKDWIWKDEYTHEDGFCLAPLLNQELFTGTPFENSGGPKTTQNPYDFTNERFYNESNDPTLEYEAWAVTPFPFLSFILDKIFTELDISISENIFVNDTELNKLFFVNQYNIVSYYKPTSQSLKQKTDKYNLKNHVPKASLNELIIALKRAFCLHFDFKDDSLRIMSIEDIFNQTEYTDISDILLDSEQKTRIEKPEEVIVGLTTPGADVLFTEVAIVDINSSIDITDPNAFINSQPDSYTYLYRRGDLWISKLIPTPPSIDLSQEKVGYIGDSNYSSKFDFFSFNMFGYTDYIQSTKLENLKSNIKTAIGIRGDFPNIDAKGNHYFNRLEGTSSDISLMLYHGLQALGESQFPFANADFFNPNGEIIGNMRLRYTHEIVVEGGNYVVFTNGAVAIPELYYSTITNRYYLQYIKWRLNRYSFELKKEVNLKLTQIKNFDYTKKYRYEGNGYYASVLETVINRNGTIQKTELTLLPE